MKRNAAKKPPRIFSIPRQRNKQKKIVFMSIGTIFRLFFLAFAVCCAATTQPSFAMELNHKTPLAASSPGMPSQINPICVSSHIDGSSKDDIDKQTTLMAQAGIAWVRFDFSWTSIEQTKGAYTWSSYDYIVNTVISKGIQVLALVPQYDLPSWERVDPTNLRSAPNNVHDFQTFVQALATHYKEKISFYEIGNEPNGPSGLKAQVYTQLLIAGYNGIKAADPMNKVISAGLANNAPESSTTNYINAMYTSGSQGHFDYFGFHPYSWPASPDFSQWPPRFDYIETVHQIMSNHGDGNKGIAITEIGWPSSTSAKGVNEATQAAYIKRIFQKIMDENYQYVPIACIYDFIDDGTDKADPEQNFGILHSDYSQKPSFKILQQLSLSYNNSNDSMTAFHNFGKAFLIILCCGYLLFCLFWIKMRKHEKRKQLYNTDQRNRV